jgi:hypothetical protein
MALKAKNIQVAGFDEVRVWGTVWRMAGHATLCLDRLVLENERPLFVSVACVANRIPRRRRAQLLADEPTVGVMTIRTLNEPFLHAVVERHVELRLDLLMAGIAETRLSLDQEKLIHHSLVGRMAAQAAQVILAVSRPGKIHVICARTVAFQTPLSDVFGSCFLKVEDFAFVTTTVDVLGAWTMTGFATVSFCAVLGFQYIVPVTGLLKRIEDILVADLAGIGPYILGGGRLLRRFVGWIFRRYGRRYL